MPKIKLSFSDFNLRRTISRILCWYSSIEQSDLSSLNSLNKNEHYKSASQNIHSGHNSTQRHSETSLMQKSLLKSTILKVLKKSVESFPRLSFGRDTTCLTKPRQRTIRKISLLHRIWQSTIRHTYRHSPYLTKPKRSNPLPHPPLFSKHFSNIYLFPDLTILVLTILSRRRFRLQEIRSHVSRDSINFATRDAFRFRKWRFKNDPVDPDDLRRYLITFHFIMFN